MTPEQAQATKKAKQIAQSVGEYLYKEWGLEMPINMHQDWADTESGQQLISSLVGGEVDKWEYRMTWISLNMIDLDNYGKDGWEMCAWYNSNQGLSCFYFKRRLNRESTCSTPLQPLAQEGYTAYFTDEQSYIDFLKWQKGEGIKVNPTEDEIVEFVKGAFQVFMGFDKYKMMDFILESKFRINPQPGAVNE